ncbi:hypothetical protein KQX54_004463 [Cotesia glomerata]|uniref:Uncharacterized protein n=1 Tax=Cotesia glomerata TaxID=32391 RepID=A0AAV7IUN1_COTGL|nr:hypothetical protein KQX54_004463 [Cotesia glomerata]
MQTPGARSLFHPWPLPPVAPIPKPKAILLGSTTAFPRFCITYAYDPGTLVPRSSLLPPDRKPLTPAASPSYVLLPPKTQAMYADTTQYLALSIKTQKGITYYH